MSNEVEQNELTSNENDDLGNQEIEEFEPYPEERSRFEAIKDSLNRRKKPLIIVSAICALLLIVTVGAVVVVVPVAVTQAMGDDVENYIGMDSGNPPNQIYSSSEDLHIGCCDKDYPYRETIWNTVEYQIGLDDLKDFKDRETGCNLYLDEFNSLTGMDMSFSNGNHSTRNEYDLSTPNCKSSTELRIRAYTSGPKKGNTTIDSKINGSSKSKALDAPLYPGQSCLPTAYQKIEHDEHECDDKYARETRCVYFSPLILETCEDVINIYPGIYSTLPEKDYKNSVSAKEIEFWYVLEHASSSFPTKLDNGTTIYSRVESTITLKYSKEEDAQSGHAIPKYGEYSFRLFAQAPGPEVDWIPEVSTQGMSIYRKMVDHFKPDNKC